MNRGALAGLVTALLITVAMVGAPSASANTYCAPAPCSDGTPEATIQDAITAANSNGGPDTVSIAPGTWNIGHDLTVGDTTTAVHGAGIGSTILTENSPTTGVRWDIIEGDMAGLSDLTLQLPSDLTPGDNSTVEGGSIDSGVVERVRVEVAPGATIGSDLNDGEASGLLLWGTSQLRDSQIVFGPDVDSDGVQALGSNVLANVSVSARKQALRTDPQSSGGTPQTVQASGLRLEAQRPLKVDDGNLELSDSLVDARTMPPGEDIGAAQVCACITADPVGSLTLDRVTIVGNGDPTESALYATSIVGGHTTTLTVRHVTAWPFGRTLSLDTSTGTVNATIAYSNLDTSGSAVVNAHPGAGMLNETFSPGNRAGNPLFRDLAGGDFRLSAGSPAIDIGGPDLIPGGTTDLNGDPRPLDGDGDGVAQDDAGAFEYKPSPAQPVPTPQPVTPVRPVVSRLRLVPAVFAIGRRRTAGIARTHRGTVIRYTLSKLATVRLSAQRRVRGVRGAHGRCVKRTRRSRRGRRCNRYATVQTLVRRKQRAGRHAVRYSGRVGHRVLRPGRYRLLARATGPKGLRSTPRTAHFRIVRR